MKTNKKLIIYSVIFKLLLIGLLITTILIIIKYGGNLINTKKAKELVDEFYTLEVSSKETSSEETIPSKEMYMGEYKIIGIIKIPKIDLEYPILDRNTEESMKLSISRYWGGEINSYGNVSLAGHNNKDGTMFGKNKKLEIGDIVELTDLNYQTITYKIYDIFITDPTDRTILETKDENVREITLITCTNGSKQRLILKAKEV